MSHTPKPNKEVTDFNNSHNLGLYGPIFCMTGHFSEISLRTSVAHK